MKQAKEELLENVVSLDQQDSLVALDSLDGQESKEPEE